MDPLYGEEMVNMKKTKTIFILLAIAMVAIVVIAGCTQPTPPATPSPTPSPTAAPKTIVVIAVDDGRFTTLVAAVQAADLATTLNGPGPFTVFAPTDDAFKKLPAGTVDTLLKEPQGQLKQILLYHVVSGSYTTDQLVQMKSVQTLQGGYLNITEVNGTVMVNDATIVIPNIKASNGMIQVIDSVLLPP
jgi:transforming growth factor-beta-induced protein